MTDQADNSYIKRYNVGTREVRIGRDSGKLFAQIYVENAREDVLTSKTLGDLEGKLERYLEGEVFKDSIQKLEDELKACKAENEQLTKSLRELGDCHAMASEYKRELDIQDKKIEELQAKVAELEAVEPDKPSKTTSKK